jgi:hypothetical protein
MNYFQVERFPDAMRTLRRLGICISPALIAIPWLKRNRFPGYDPVQFQPLIEFDRTLYAGLLLFIFSVAIAAFSLWQVAARNILLDERGLDWLLIHGWEGDVQQLPQRALLPISELVGLLFVFTVGECSTSGAVIFLPMCWSLGRMANFWKTSALESPYRFGTMWILHAAAVQHSETRWLSVPIEFAAIVLTEWQIISSLHRKAGELLDRNIKFEAKPLDATASYHPASRRRARLNRIVSRLYPFSYLGAVDSQRPSWKMAIWTAFVVACVTFCLITRVAEFGQFTNKNGDTIYLSYVVGTTGLSAIVVIQSLRLLVQLGNLGFSPRLNLIARIKLLRPILWATDRIVAPLVLNIAIIALAASLQSMMTPFVVTFFAFIEMLILLRCGVTLEEWQMTADLKLSPPNHSTSVTSTRSAH